MKKIIPLTLFLFCSLTGQSQFKTQYFDGSDTSLYNSIFVEMDSNAAKVWHIGPPQKSIFDAAATLPNAILTDTLLPYPDSTEASFFMSFDSVSWPWSYGVAALQWKQKLDLEHGRDFGRVEYSIDGGQSWDDPFDNPWVYNFYGFDSANVGITKDSIGAFTGQDSVWKDIWLCFDIFWFYQTDSLTVRFTLESDSNSSGQEGWMMDNFMAHTTWIHTLESFHQDEYLNVSPNPTNGRVNIRAKRKKEFHIIEEIKLFDSNGEILEEYHFVPTKFFVDLSSYPNGVYLLKVKTNFESETFKIVHQNH